MHAIPTPQVTSTGTCGDWTAYFLEALFQASHCALCLAALNPYIKDARTVPKPYILNPKPLEVALVSSPPEVLAHIISVTASAVVSRA